MTINNNIVDANSCRTGVRIDSSTAEWAELIADAEGCVERLRQRAASFVDVGRKAARDGHGRASGRFGHRATELADTADVIEELLAALRGQPR